MTNSTTLEQLIANVGGPKGKAQSDSPYSTTLEQLIKNTAEHEDSFFTGIGKANKRFIPSVKEKGAAVVENLLSTPQSSLDAIVTEAQNPSIFSPAKNLYNAAKIAGTALPYGIGKLFSEDPEQSARDYRLEQKDILESPGYAHERQGKSLSGLGVDMYEGLIQSLPAFAASYLTKSAAPFFADAAVGTKALARAEAIDAGKTGSEADDYGNLLAFYDTLSTVIPVKTFLKGGTIGRRMFNLATANGISEIPRKTAEMITRRAMLNPNISDREILNEVLYAGAVATGVGAAIGVGGGKGTDTSTALPSTQKASTKEAATAATAEGKPTLDELINYLEKNKNEISKETIQENKALSEENIKDNSEPETKSGDLGIEKAAVEPEALLLPEKSQENIKPEEAPGEEVPTRQEQPIRSEPETDVARAESIEQAKTEEPKLRKQVEKIERKTPKEEVIAHELTQDEYLNASKDKKLQSTPITLEQYAQSQNVAVPSKKVRDNYQRILDNGPKNGTEKNTLARNKEKIDAYNSLVDSYKEKIDSGDIASYITHNAEAALRGEHRAAIENAIANNIPVSKDILSGYPDLAKLQKYRKADVKHNIEAIKSDLIDNIKVINPKANLEFARRLFGEGKALLDSGAASKRRTEVAGSYDKLKDIIKLSLNQTPRDMKKVAYHEAFHALEDVLTPREREVLNNQYPAQGKRTTSELAAEGFAKYMNSKDKPAGSPFSKINGLIADIGKITKNHAPETGELFQAIETGLVGRRKLEASEVSSIVSANDLESLALVNRFAREGKFEGVSKETAVDVAKELKSPALEEIVKKSLSPEDEAKLKEVIADHTNDPDDVVYSLFDDKKFGHNTLEKITDKAIGALEPIIGKASAEKLRAEKEETYRILSAKSTKSGLGAIAETLRVLFRANDSVIRSRAKRFNAPSLTKLADLFNPDPGSHRSIDQTYFEAIPAFSQKLSYILKEAMDGLTDSQRAELTKLQQGYGDAEPGSLLEKRLNTVKALQDKLTRSLTNSGIEVGVVEDYVMRKFDKEAILNNREDFIKKATEAYVATQKANGEDVDVDSAHASAEAWYNHLERQDAGVGTQTYELMVLDASKPSGERGFLKERSLSKEADEILRSYLHQDIGDLLETQIAAVSKLVAFEERLGGNKYTMLGDDLKALGFEGDSSYNTIRAAKDADLLNGTKKGLKELSNLLIESGLTESEAEGVIRAATKREKDGVGSRFDGYIKNMEREGVPPDLIADTADIIRQYVGANRSKIPQYARTTAEFAKLSTYITHLPRSVMAQANEFLITGLQSNSIVKGSLKALVGRLQNLFNMFKESRGLSTNEKQDFLKNFMDLMGVVSERSTSMLMAARNNINPETSTKVKLVSDRFFKKTAQTAVSQADRIAAGNVGRMMITDLLNDVTKGKRNAKSSMLMLSDLGIKKTHIDPLFDYVQKADSAIESKNLNFFIDESDPMGKMYQTAIIRFVNSAIITGDATTRLRISGHPVWSIGLTFFNYTMGFTKNVIQKSYRNTKKGLNPKEDLTLADRAQLASSLLAAPVLLAAAMGLNEAKDFLFGDPEKEEKSLKEKFIQGLRQSSLLGGLDYFAGVFQAIHYGDKSGGILGAFGSNIMRLIGVTQGLFDKNSPNTNTAERKALSTYIDLIVMPLFNYGVSTYIPGSTVPFAAIQAANNPKTKRAAVDAIAGKPYRKTPPRPKKTAAQKLETKRKNQLKAKEKAGAK